MVGSFKAKQHNEFLLQICVLNSSPAPLPTQRCEAHKSRACAIQKLEEDIILLIPQEEIILKPKTSKKSNKQPLVTMSTN
jgi:hypothetical protein